MNEKPYGVEFVGPFALPPYRITADGYSVPHLAAHLKAGTEGTWVLVLDSRFMLEATHEEACRWLPFLANAMAVAAGYSSHGANSRRANPFSVQMMGIEAQNAGNTKETEG